MLRERVLATLRFFDLQDLPLTLLELHKYLLTDLEIIKNQLNENWDLISSETLNYQEPAAIQDILFCLENECAGKVGNYRGFYYLTGPSARAGENRKKIVQLRLDNYLFGIKRERLIWRFGRMFKYLPFVRGAAISGSQALGQQKATSDIDLFIITDPDYLWLARIFATFYFQILGKRRHGKKIADRFCLNHYAAGAKSLGNHRDLYNAMEYLRFRPLTGFFWFEEFYKNNRDWLARYFPNSELNFLQKDQPSKTQKFLEKIFANGFGRFLNKMLGKWQLWRIKRGEFVVADQTELSFHSVARKKALLAEFFGA